MRKKMTVDPPRKHKRTSINQSVYGYIFVAPILFGLIFMFLLPLGQTLWLSVNNAMMTADGMATKFNGFQNFYDVLFVDTQYREQVFISIGNMLLNVPLIVIFSFFIATLLNQKFHGKAVVRAIFFLPLVLASTALVNFDAGDLLQNIMGNSMAFKDNTAVVSGFDSANMATALVAAGLPETIVEYLLLAAERIYQIVTLSGVQILIFLAALQSIPGSVYESASIEGASGWEKYWKITFPMVSPMIALAIIYSIIDSFSSSKTIDLIQDKMFTVLKFGQASAMSVVYSVLVLVIIGIVFGVTRRITYYADK